jgi:iron complex transport system permease protein
MVTRGRFARVAAASAAFLLLALVLTPLVGSSDATLARAWAGVSPDREILFEVRLPRTTLAALAGGALALAGVIFQAMLRDALATPFTLGVSNGAALGAVLAICLGWRTFLGLPAMWVSALVGAALTMALVTGAASEGRRMSSFTLLLTGVAVNSMAMAAILFLHYSAGFTQSFAIVRWLMGGIDSPSPGVLGGLSAAILAVLAIAMWISPRLNLLSVGDDWTATRGADPRALTRLCFVLGSFLTAAVTAFTGPIGFVGLIVPHALRMAVGADHRLLVPAAFCVGGGFLAICDTVARTAMAPTEIPVGVITAMLGGPFFIWLLRGRRGSLWQ